MYIRGVDLLYLSLMYFDFFFFFFGFCVYISMFISIYVFDSQTLIWLLIMIVDDDEVIHY